MGGLGNQLFQYALYRKLYSEGKNAYCDLSWHYDKSHDYYYPYQLDLLGLPKREIKSDEYKVVNKYDILSGLFTKRLCVRNYYEEKAYQFDSGVFKANNVLFDGYWQNVDYFEDILPEILKDIHFPDVSTQSKIIMERIMNRNSVSVHIRRNNYEFEEFNRMCPLLLRQH